MSRLRRWRALLENLVGTLTLYSICAKARGRNRFKLEPIPGDWLRPQTAILRYLQLFSPHDHFEQQGKPSSRYYR